MDNNYYDRGVKSNLPFVDPIYGLGEGYIDTDSVFVKCVKELQDGMKVTSEKLVQCIISSKASGRPLSEHLAEAGLSNDMFNDDVVRDIEHINASDIVINVQMQSRDEILKHVKSC